MVHRRDPGATALSKSLPSILVTLLAALLAAALPTFYGVVRLVEPLRSSGCDTSGPHLAISSDVPLGPTFIASPGPTCLLAALFASAVPPFLLLRASLFTSASFAPLWLASMHFCLVSKLTATVSQPSSVSSSTLGASARAAKRPPLLWASTGGRRS